MFFGDWLLSFYIMFWNPIHVACIGSSFLLLNNISCINTAHFIINLSDDGHLDYFHFLIIMNNATMNICVKVFVWECVLIFLKKYLKVESYFNFIFNILRNCQTLSKVAGPFYISTSNELRVSISQHPHHLLLSFLL